MNFMTPVDLALEEDQWGEVQQKQLAEMLEKSSTLQAALKIIENTANNICYAVGANADFSNDQGIRDAMARQARALGMKQTLAIIQSLAEEEPKDERPANTDN